jgi:hypothetical protein
MYLALKLHLTSAKSPNSYPATFSLSSVKKVRDGEVKKRKKKPINVAVLDITE